MTNHPDKPPPGGASEPLDDLIDGLQGTAHKGPSGAAGQALRAWLAQDEPRRDAESAAFEDRLIARWRSEGMLAGRGGATGRASGRSLATWWRRHWAWLAAPASVLATAGVVMLVVVRQPEAPPGSDGHRAEDAGPAMRGAEQAQTIANPNPAELAERIAAVLQPPRFKLRRERLGAAGYRIQALVPADELQARRELAALGLDVPSHGRLDVLIQPARP